MIRPMPMSTRRTSAINASWPASDAYCVNSFLCARQITIYQVNNIRRRSSHAAAAESALGPNMADQKIRNMVEFARISGISRTTVSKYFNYPSSVRTSTRARVEQHRPAACRNVGYEDRCPPRPRQIHLRRHRLKSSCRSILQGVTYLAIHRLQDPCRPGIRRQCEFGRRPGRHSL